jgi:hypothetical protein
MSNGRYVEVSRQGYFSRLANSFAGILIGFVLAVGAIPLLWWNEGRAVVVQRALDEATRLVVDIEADRVDPSNNGKLVHVSGDAVSRNAIRDGDLGLVFNDVIIVSRTVEMFQWIEDKDTKTIDEIGGGQRTQTTYSYRRGWSEDWKNSEQFRNPTGHANPAMPLKSQKWTASGTTLGAFTLERDFLQKLRRGPPTQPDKIPDGWKPAGEGLYRGDNPSSPKLGDLRVRYDVKPSPAPVSILARQMGTGFETYEMPNGVQIKLFSDGLHSADEMIKKRRQTEKMITWSVRAAGMLLMWLGFCLIMGPLRALANILPFLADVAGLAIGIVAAALALPIGLGTVGIAWLFYRPIIGIAVLAIGIVLGWLLVRYRYNIAPAAAPYHR